MLSALFELFTYGILLLERDGRMVELNEAARDALGRSADNADSRDLTCCELFGCRRRVSPLEHGCLAKLAAEAGMPLPEMRVDLPPGSTTGSVWVTAAPFLTQPARVLVNVRPADGRVRSSGNGPLGPAVADLEIFTFGRTMVYSSNGPVGGPWLRHRPGKLLKFLICWRRRTVTVEEIVETLWPGADQRVVANVRFCVHELRSQLEPDRPTGRPSRFILTEPGGYRLNTETVLVDADHFERAVAAGLQRLTHDDHDGASRLLTDALRLYGGDFLAEERYAIWAFSERDRLRSLAGEALAALGQIRRLAGDLDGAARHLERLGDMYPLDSEIQRDVIAIALEQGRHTVAQWRYAALRRRHFQEFGRGPSFDLSDVAASIGETSRPAPRRRA
jgi:DNA-binding SARP family transcriptional activator